MGSESIRTGTVIKKFAKSGYGFIKDDDDENYKDLFYHASEVVDPIFDDLKIGTTVNYLIKAGPRGTKAISIVAIPDKQ